MKKLIPILKAAGDYCIISAGVVSIIIGVVAVFVTIPVIIPFVVAGGVGILCAFIGAHHESKQLQRMATRQNEVSGPDQHYREIKGELDKIKEKLELHAQHNSVPSEAIPRSLLNDEKTEPQEAPIYFLRLPQEKGQPTTATLEKLSLFSLEREKSKEEKQHSVNDAVFFTENNYDPLNEKKPSA